MSRIRREFGALSGLKESIRAGEILLAWDSALLWTSAAPYLRLAHARNLVTSGFHDLRAPVLSVRFGYLSKSNRLVWRAIIKSSLVGITRTTHPLSGVLMVAA